MVLPIFHMLSIWTTPYILTTTLSRKIKISIEEFPLHPKPDAEVVPIGQVSERAAGKYHWSRKTKSRLGSRQLPKRQMVGLKTYCNQW